MEPLRFKKFGGYWYVFSPEGAELSVGQVVPVTSKKGDSEVKITGRIKTLRGNIYRFADPGTTVETSDPKVIYPELLEMPVVKPKPPAVYTDRRFVGGEQVEDMLEREERIAISKRRVARA